MGYNFDFGAIGEKGAISINRLGLRVNPEIVRFFGDSDVMIGYDKEGKALCISKWDGDLNIEHYNLKERVRKHKWAEIGCRRFVRRLVSDLGICLDGHSLTGNVETKMSEKMVVLNLSECKLTTKRWGNKKESYEYDAESI